jgi:hypothetical protein
VRVDAGNVRDAGGSVADVVGRACDYPGLSLAGLSVSAGDYLFWSFIDLGRALRTLSGAFPSVPPGCGRAHTYATDGGSALLAAVEKCPLSFGGRSLLVTGSFEYEAIHTFDPGPLPTRPSVDYDMKAIRDTQEGAELVFSELDGSVAFIVTNFGFSETHSVTQSIHPYPGDTLIHDVTASYVDGRSCHPLRVTIHAERDRFTDFTQTIEMSASDGVSTLSIPNTLIFNGQGTATLQFAAVADAGIETRTFDSSILFATSPPTLDPRVACNTWSTCPRDAGMD